MTTSGLIRSTSRCFPKASWSPGTDLGESASCLSRLRCRPPWGLDQAEISETLTAVKEARRAHSSWSQSLTPSARVAVADTRPPDRGGADV